MTFLWWPLLPVLAPAAAALLVLLLDALFPKVGRVHLWVGVAALLTGAAAAFSGALGARGSTTLSLCLPAPEGACLSSASPAASALQIAILGACAGVLLLRHDARSRPSEAAVPTMLVLASAAGGAGVVAARDLGSWLVLLELATLPTIALVALATGARAAHGALSLLLTSLISFALLVLGVALWLLATGSALFSPVAVQAAAAEPARAGLLTVAVLTLIAGVAFKLSAIPFHAWTPITFSAAPTPIAALLATASKLAAVGALLMVLAPLTAVVGALPGTHTIAAALGALAVLSFVGGNLIALRASDAMRLLAWSTVAQAGWVLLPLMALSDDGSRASVAYVITYAVASLTIFAILTCVPADADGRRPLTAYRGLLRSRPWLGGPLAFALLVLAGLPPGIIGLVAKVMALRPLMTAGLWPVALVAVLAIVLGIVVYLRWLVILWQPHDETAAPPTIVLPRGAIAVIGLGTAALIAMSALPQLLWGLLG